MIRRGHYSSKNFQDSRKRKSTKKKTLGYLPRVLFFNTFELGAKSKNQGRLLTHHSGGWHGDEEVLR